jgi:hypothetical protein
VFDLGSWQERFIREETIEWLINQIAFELYYARHNIENCPAEHSKDEIENLGELQHVDMHIKNAKLYLEELRRELGFDSEDC